MDVVAMYITATRSKYVWRHFLFVYFSELDQRFILKTFVSPYPNNKSAALHQHHRPDLN